MIVLLTNAVTSIQSRAWNTAMKFSTNVNCCGQAEVQLGRLLLGLDRDQDDEREGYEEDDGRYDDGGDAAR